MQRIIEIKRLSNVYGNEKYSDSSTLQKLCAASGSNNTSTDIGRIILSRNF